MASRGDEDGPPETLWVEDTSQMSVGLAARRQDIVDRLLAFGPLSVKELAVHLGARPSALYHHLRMLLDSGLALDAGFRVVSRKRERLYAAPARTIRLRLRPDDLDNRAAVQGFIRALGRQIDQDFVVGQALPGATTEGPGRNLGLRRLCGSPDAATLARINRKLDEIGELLANSRGRPSGGVVLSWTIAPLQAPSIETE